MKKKVMVATPMYGGQCFAIYVQGLLTATNHLKSNGVDTVWVNIANESLITRARNELVRIFLDETDATHLMFIDADIGFGFDTIQVLLDADRDVTCAMYPKKEVNWSGVARAVEKGKKPDELQDYAGSFVVNMLADKAETDEQGMIEVRHGGTGFMLIKREVFEKLADKVPEYRANTGRDADGNYLKPLTKEFFATSIDHTGALLSEDWHFCDLWRGNGGRIFANPFIKLAHAGTHFFGGDMVKSGANPT